MDHASVDTDEDPGDSAAWDGSFDPTTSKVTTQSNSDDDS